MNTSSFLLERVFLKKQHTYICISAKTSLRIQLSVSQQHSKSYKNK